MKILGTITVDKLPESCSGCTFSSVFGHLLQFKCKISDKPIPSNFVTYRRAWFCKLRAKRKQVRKLVKKI